MEIQQRDREGITILDLSGRLVVGEPSGEIRAAITNLQGEGKINVLLNLKDLDYIDSTGLGSMVICFTSLQKAGGALKLVKLNKRNLELLVLTKLSTVFEIFNDEQDGVNSYFPDRKIAKFDILEFIQDQKDK